MASGASWSWWVVGAQPSAGATSGGLFAAILWSKRACNGCNRRCCAQMRFFGRVRGSECVACAHLLFPSLSYIVVCLLYACGSGKKGPLDPLSYTAVIDSFPGPYWVQIQLYQIMLSLIAANFGVNEQCTN